MIGHTQASLLDSGRSQVEVYYDWFHAQDDRDFIIEVASSLDSTDLNFVVADTLLGKETHNHYLQSEGAYRYTYKYSGASEGMYLWLRVATVGNLLHAAPTEPTRLLVPFFSSGQLMGQQLEGAGTVELFWKDIWDTEEFFIIHRTFGDTGKLELVDTIPANTTSYTDTFRPSHMSGSIFTNYLWEIN